MFRLLQLLGDYQAQERASVDAIQMKQSLFLVIN